MTSIRNLLDRALERLSGVGADPADDEDARRRKGLLVLTAVLIIPIALVWWVLYTRMGTWTGNIALAYALVSLGSILLFARIRNFGLLLNIQLLAIAISPTISMLPNGGFMSTGGVGIWGMLAPLGALVFDGTRAGIRWFVAWAVLFLGSGILGVALGFTSPLPEWFSHAMLAVNVTVGAVVVFTLLALFVRQREEALAALRVEQRRAEDLLLNILPGSIAERLKSHPGTIADSFETASVLFADVVDFTPRTERLAAAEIVGLLDRLFGHFDELAERYGLEKIKTIGDSYMVAAGVPNPREDHAVALANVALDMCASVAPGGAVGDLGLQLRIGINSGPVVAGVIGRKRFLYDLWGDAVNTASRMETHGTPGQIQVTAATRELLLDTFILEPRGSISVKGKGDMETWYLVGRRGSADPAADAGAPEGRAGSTEPSQPYAATTT